MKRKILSAVMAALMIAGMALPGFAYNVGDKVSTYAYTDIVTYINDTAIESFNINWNTAVIVEDLADYGFNVVWDPTPGNRNLKVTRNYSKPFSATYVPKASTHKNGDYAGDVLYTDIVTYFEGQKVESFNINGRTIVYVDDIATFYAQPGTYKYNDSSRILSLTLKGAASTAPAPAPTPTPSSPLKITTQPKSVNAAANDAVNFSVAVTGGKSPYTYKWEMKKASDASWSDAGGSAAIYSFTASQALIDGGYMFRCVVTDADGTTVYSDYALLQPKAVPTVTTPLTIVAQPQNQAAATLYEALTYTIGVSGGTAPYYYSWQVSTDGISWYEAGTSHLQTYQLTANTVSTSGIKYVRCVVSDSAYQTVTSQIATASVGGGGGSSAGTYTSNITISGAVTGTALSKTMTLTDYGWPASGIIAVDSSNNTLASYGLSAVYNPTAITVSGTPTKAGTATFTLTGTASDSTLYIVNISVVITGGGGSSSALSASLISSYTATAGAALTGVIVPNITNGSGSYSYEWYYMREGMMSSYAVDTTDTDSDYDFPAGSLFDGAVWKIYCVVTDKVTGQKATTNVCVLTVKAAPSTPLTATCNYSGEVKVAEGSNLTFTVTASGGKSPYTYEWQFKSDTSSGWYKLPYSNGTNTWNANNITTTYHPCYRCLVTDANGNSVYTSEIRLVPATTPLVITKNPNNVHAKAGATVSFSISASGGKAPYTYKWCKINPYGGLGYPSDGAAYSGTTTATLTVTSYGTTISDNGSRFYCIVTDADGKTATSESATLGVMTVTVTSSPNPVSLGKSVTLTAVASGESGSFTNYKWYREGSSTPIQNGTSSTFTYSTSTKGSFGYYCVVTASNGAQLASDLCYVNVI